MNKSDFFTTYKKQILIIAGVVFLMLILSVILFNKRTLIENTWLTGSKYVFGIDVSHYQGKINWSKVKRSKHPIKYVFIRSTMGADGVDSQFERNWKEVKEHGYIRGAYHYYRPNENSTDQFNAYARSVKLAKGDFPPILDIEQKGSLSNAELRKGVLNWLKLAEKKYGVKPVIYTGRKFYQFYLKGYVKEYPLWIASYSKKHKLKGIKWTFHQFSERVRIKGIHSFVDGNDFDGNIDQLKKKCLK